MKHEGMPAGQPKDPHGAYSHLRHEGGAKGPVKQDPVTSMESSGRGEHHAATHTHLRSKGNFEGGSAAPATEHVGDHHTGHPGHPKGEAAHTGLEAHHHADGVRAEHLPPVSGEPHHIARPPTGPTSGFGHAAHQRHGHLRMSGAAGAHRIGKR